MIEQIQLRELPKIYSEFRAGRVVQKGCQKGSVIRSMTYALFAGLSVLYAYGFWNLFVLLPVVVLVGLIFVLVAAHIQAIRFAWVVRDKAFNNSPVDVSLNDLLLFVVITLFGFYGVLYLIFTLEDKHFPDETVRIVSKDVYDLLCSQARSIDRWNDICRVLENETLNDKRQEELIVLRRLFVAELHDLFLCYERGEHLENPDWIGDLRACAQMNADEILAFHLRLVDDPN